MKWSTVAWCVVMLAVGGTWASDRTIPPRAEMEYVYPEQSVWTARTDDNGVSVNPLLPLARALFERAGVPWRATAYPAARMFAELRGGGPAFSLLVAAPGLRECCVVSRAPVARTELRLYWRGDTPPVRRIEDLAGKAVVVIRGYSYGEQAAFLNCECNRVTRAAVDGHRAAFQMLEYGRAEYVLDYGGPADEILAAHPIADIHWAVLADAGVHMVLNRSYPDAEAMMHRLEMIAARLDIAALLQAGLNPYPAR